MTNLWLAVPWFSSIRLTTRVGGGVFVAWFVHHVLTSAAVDALSGGRTGDSAIHLSGTVKSAMQDAMAEILSAAGCTVAKDINDMAPFELQVKGRRPA